MELKCISYSLKDRTMDTKNDYDNKNREIDRDQALYLNQDGDLDWDIDTGEDLEWDPDEEEDIDGDIEINIDEEREIESEASRYNDEELLDSDHQVNEQGALREHGDFREGDSDSEYPAHEDEDNVHRKGNDNDYRIVN